MEEFRVIAGFEGFYSVSNLGRVRNNRTGHIIKSRIEKNGYVRCALWVRGVAKWVCVHSLVAEAFISKRPPGMDVDHINNNRSDNRVENLQFLSRSSNVKKAMIQQKRGVTLSKVNKKSPQRYRADIWIDGRRRFIGSWLTREEAQSAYDKKHKEVFGY